jgi:hypothetical protein
VIQITDIQTDKAERLMKALCNHFARKITARYESNKGYIEFGDGKCEITSTPESLAHVERVVVDHLLRFTPEETFQIDWRDSSRE